MYNLTESDMKEVDEYLEETSERRKELIELLNSKSEGFEIIPMGNHLDEVCFFVHGQLVDMAEMKGLTVSSLNDLSDEEYVNFRNEVIDRCDEIVHKTQNDVKIEDYNLLTDYYKNTLFDIGSNYRDVNYTLIHKDIVGLLPNYNRYTGTKEMKVLLKDGTSRYPKKYDFIEWSEKIWDLKSVLELDIFGEEEPPKLSVQDVLNDPEKLRIYVDGFYGESCAEYYDEIIHWTKDIVSSGIINPDEHSVVAGGGSHGKTLRFDKNETPVLVIKEDVIGREFRYKFTPDGEIITSSTWEELMKSLKEGKK